MNKILNFHLVNDGDWFDKIIRIIRSRYNMVSIGTLEQYYRGEISLKNACHITVDDGDETFYRVIYPVLKKYNIPASLYVSPKIFNEGTNYWFQEIEGYEPEIVKQITAQITGTPPEILANHSVWDVMKVLTVNQIHRILEQYRRQTGTPLKPYQNMTIAQLQEVDRDGLVTIGAHTMSHPILMNEADESSYYEINQSIIELTQLLGHPVKCFSYPNGILGYDFTERECETLKNNGISLAFSTEARAFSSADNFYKIPRIGVSNAESMFFFKTKLLMGPLWLMLKKLKPSGEYINRTAIKNLMQQP